MTVVRACFHAISFSLRAARLARARSPRCVRLKSGGCSYAIGFRLPSRRKASPHNRLAVRRAGLALMRKRCEELLAVRMPAEPKKFAFPSGSHHGFKLFRPWLTTCRIMVTDKSNGFATLTAEQLVR